MDLRCGFLNRFRAFIQRSAAGMGYKRARIRQRWRNSDGIDSPGFGEVLFKGVTKPNCGLNVDDQSLMLLLLLLSEAYSGRANQHECYMYIQQTIRYEA